jgi:hypothetical protein
VGSGKGIIGTALSISGFILCLYQIYIGLTTGVIHTMKTWDIVSYTHDPSDFIFWLAMYIIAVLGCIAYFVALLFGWGNDNDK